MRERTRDGTKIRITWEEDGEKASPLPWLRRPLWDLPSHLESPGALADALLLSRLAHQTRNPFQDRRTFLSAPLSYPQTQIQRISVQSRKNKMTPKKTARFQFPTPPLPPTALPTAGPRGKQRTETNTSQFSTMSQTRPRPIQKMSLQMY